MATTTSEVQGDDRAAIPIDFDKHLHELSSEAFRLYKARDYDAFITKQRQLINFVSEYYAADHWVVVINKEHLHSIEGRLKLSEEMQATVATADKRLDGGKLFLRERNFVRAIDFLEDALKNYRESVGENDIATLDCMHELSIAQLSAGYFDHAWLNCESATERIKEKLGASSPKRATYLATLSTIAYFRGDHRRAEELANDGLEAIGLAKMLEWPDHGRLLVCKAMALNALKRHDEALVAGQCATSILSMYEPRNFKSLFQAQAEIAAAYLGSNRPEECMNVFRRMRPLLEQHPDDGPTGGEQKRWLTIHRSALVKLNRIEEADSVAKQILEID